MNYWFYDRMAWLEDYGVPVGSFLVCFPIGYDFVGILYGRDPDIKIGTIGVVVQIIGLIVIALGKYAKRWLR